MIDSHSHLDNSQFNPDRPEVFQRAWDAGLSHIVLIGMVPSTLDLALKLHEQYPDRTVVTAGVHPHDSAEWSPAIEARLAFALKDPRIKALGECGLDYYRNYAPHDIQHQCFTRQLELAKEHRLPFVLHCRDAYDDCFSLIRRVFGSAIKPLSECERPLGVAHCFSGNAAQAEEFVRLGMLLSFAGGVTYRAAVDLQEAARRTSPTQWMVETDAPYLAPMPHRGKRNEPAFVMRTASFLAELKGISIQELDAATTRNAKWMFGIK